MKKLKIGGPRQLAPDQPPMCSQGDDDANRDDCLRYGESDRRRVRLRAPGLLRPDRQAAPVLP